MIKDLNFGWRMLWRNPGFTILAALALALGIGANTAIFSVVNAVMLQRMPFERPDRLVTVWESSPHTGKPNVINPTNFSNTTSSVGNANLRYAMIDVGWAYHVPEAGVRFGGFVGYHYWHESTTAFGLMCNADQVFNALCGPAGAAIVSSGTPVVAWDTTWHAIRVGADARIQVTDRWSVSGEVAFVPYAWMTNDDSHLLRTDLGPVPNILTRGWRGMGGEAEAFVNYKVLPHFEIGAGVRYWGLFTQAGSVEFGPTFGPDFPLTKFSTQRYGVLLQAKATF